MINALAWHGRGIGAPGCSAASLWVGGVLGQWDVGGVGAGRKEDGEEAGGQESLDTRGGPIKMSTK